MGIYVYIGIALAGILIVVLALAIADDMEKLEKQNGPASRQDHSKKD